MSLSEYRFITIYKKGACNKAADYLSRCKDNNTISDSVSTIFSDKENNRFIKLWGLQNYNISSKINCNDNNNNNIIYTINGIEKKRKISKVLTSAEEIVKNTLKKQWEIDDKKKEDKQISSEINKELLDSIGFKESLEPIYISKEYKQDNYFDIINYIIYRDLPEDEKEARRIIRESEYYCISDEDGLVFHGNIKEDRLELCIPKSMIRTILDIFHNNQLIGGHTGFKKTYFKIKKYFFWPGMIRDIRIHLRNYETCQYVERKYGSKKDIIHSVPIIEPWHTIAIDFLGPFTKSHSGWVEAFATPDRKSERVAKILYDEIICRYGAPQCLLSDNAAEFLSEVMSKLFSLFGVKKLNTSTYHPQTNGKCEHFNGVLLRMLKKYVENYRSRVWDQQIHSLLFVVRTAINTTTGYSPFYLMYGREPNLPIGLVSKVNYENQLVTPVADDLVSEIKNNLVKAYHETKFKHSKYQQKQNSYNNNNKTPIPGFKVGDLVLVEGLESKDDDDDNDENVENKKSYKLKRKWYGPFKILKVNGNGCYNIDDPDNFLV
ncbi:hypothetical protein ACTFIZ_007616 [Dictyostelium cf. discoideum]